MVDKKDIIIDLYQSLNNQTGPAKLKLYVQLTDSRHDTSNGTFALAETLFDAKSGLFINHEPSDDKRIDGFSDASLDFLNGLQSYIRNEFRHMTESDKDAKRLALEMQKANIENQLKNL